MGVGQAYNPLLRSASYVSVKLEQYVMEIIQVDFNNEVTGGDSGSDFIL